MIPVEPAYLYSIRQQASFTWKKMLCELIDNAFDASANQVDVAFPGGKVFRVEDNGVGSENLMRFVTLGKRQDHATNDVGKYGVGCKLALIWLWGISVIDTATVNASQHLEMDWEAIANGEAVYPDNAEPGSRVITGTKIECRGDRHYPKFETLMSGLASTYTPGIELGKNIFFSQPRSNPRKLQGRPWPKVSEEIDTTVEAAGRSVRIRMGIVADGQPNLYSEGFAFERTYRVIKETTLGANGFAVGRIAARITLGKEWELSTNKDDLTEYQDELADAIYDRCESLMKKASQQAVTIEDNSFNQELAKIVEQSERTRKRESRNAPTNESGGVEPKDTGRRRETAQKITDNDGSVIADPRKASKRRGFTIEAYEDASGSMTFGKYDPDGNRVRLNIGNPWLKQKHSERNQDALIPVIYGILAESAHRGEARRNPLFVNQQEDLLTQWGTSVAAASGKEVKV